jgi:hypothetical protein
MIKFFDVVNEIYLDLDANDISSYFDGGIKIKSKYYRVILNKQENTYYVFDVSNVKKDLKKGLDAENKYVIKCKFDYVINSVCAKFHVPFYDKREMNIGDKCIVGAWTNCTIFDKDARGFYYIKHYAAKWQIEKNPELIDKPNYDVVHWSEVYPVIENPHVIKFNENNVRYYNQDINGLLTKFFHFGVDLNPEYQRGNVWSDEQKELLIDSIYKRINIGSFVFVEKKWFHNNDVTDYMYEILDGKQRYTAILDYIMGKFPYHGKYYHELSPVTRNEFENCQVLIGELQLDKNTSEYNKKKVLEQFIRLNECGTTMDKSIIENARKIMEK